MVRLIVDGVSAVREKQHAAGESAVLWVPVGWCLDFWQVRTASAADLRGASHVGCPTGTVTELRFHCLKTQSIPKYVPI